ncbi:MAG: type I 3-dehydroquinate dehydratase [Ignavibacteriae bacterium]|nr:type I 3-dehydroquinate dehydratase [Ignavibacteriota bacterium]
MNEAFQKIKQAVKETELIEIRVDGISDLDISKLLQKPRPKFIITNRRIEEGGKFSGSLNENLKILAEAVKHQTEYVDIELSWGTNAVQQLVAQSAKTKIIVSYHNFDETPSNLFNIYKKMKTTGAHVFKIVTMAKDISDNKTMFDLLTLARSEKRKLLAFCMGERGQISRILQGKFGGQFMYAPISVDEETAPGQLNIQDLKNTFRVHILNSRTKVFGLIGNPVSQSKGIYFHNSIFARKNLNAVYVNFLVDNLPLFFKSYRDMICGLSVTMPFKQEILPMLDEVETDANELRAVNTVIKKRKKLYGTNTDLPAILQCLKKRTSLRNKRVTVLGTGGTARTMAYAAILIGAKTTIIGRNENKSRTLANELGCEWAKPKSFSEVHTDILMNGTSVGMNSTEIPFNVHNHLRHTMTVFDAVYSPPMTSLLVAAKAAGCKIITGLEFFQTQAKLQSKLFTESL